MKLFIRQLRGEFRKLFARKRTFIGFGAFALLEVVILLLLQLPGPQRFLSRAIENAGYDSVSYISGPTIGMLMVGWTILMLGALYLALVGGDVVSKEVEDGSMRMILCRPISRGRILLLKGIVSMVYTAVLTVFVMVTAMTVSVLYGGTGSWFVFAPVDGVVAFHDFWPGLWRYLVAIPLLSISLCTVTAIAFSLSCFNMKPSAATVVTLSFLFADNILRMIPYFESLKGWFITVKMGVWIKVFEYRVPWETMLEQYAWLLAIDATLFLIGWMAFEQRDFKS